MDKPRGRFALAGWGLLLGLLSFVGIVIVTVAITSLSLGVIAVGIPLTIMSLALLRRFADWHRWWTATHLGLPIARPYRPRPAGGWLIRLWGLLTDRATYRDVAWVLVNASAGLAVVILPAAFILAIPWYLIAWPLLFHLDGADFDSFYGYHVPDRTTLFLLGIGSALVFGALFWVTTRPLMRAYGRLNRWLLAPVERDRLANRIAQLTESRAETVDTQAVELRRIERDLHDGAQARLVSLGMSLGMAEELLASDPNAAGELLADAREATGLALAELRDLVRGIHPPVLADRGLDGAVRALALASPLPVEVTVDMPGRPPAPVESALYFAVAETLTNAAKHSHARSAWIRLAYADGRLGVMVGDDGHGGAEQQAGGGLHGIERRLAAFDGTMVVASPVGGPTIVTMQVPCALSPAKVVPASGPA